MDDDRQFDQNILICELGLLHAGYDFSTIPSHKFVNYSLLGGELALLIGSHEGGG